MALSSSFAVSGCDTENSPGSPSTTSSDIVTASSSGSSTQGLSSRGGAGETSSGSYGATTDAASTTAGEVGDSPEELDAWCSSFDDEQSCSNDSNGNPRGPCDWVQRYEFADGAGCDAGPAISECRAVFPAGDGCGSVVDADECEAGSSRLNDDTDTPFYRVDGTSASLVVSTVCGPPVGYSTCDPSVGELPSICFCLCGPDL